MLSPIIFFFCSPLFFFCCSGVFSHSSLYFPGSVALKGRKGKQQKKKKKSVTFTRCCHPLGQLCVCVCVWILQKKLAHSATQYGAEVDHVFISTSTSWMPFSCCCCCCSTTSCRSHVMILICSCFGAKKKKSIIRGVEFSVNEQKGKKKKLQVNACHCGHLPAPLFFFKPFFFFSIIHIFPLSLSLSFWPSSVFFAFFFFLTVLFFAYLFAPPPLSVTPQFCYCFFFIIFIFQYTLFLCFYFCCCCCCCFFFFPAALCRE